MCTVVNAGNCWGNKDTLKLACALAEMRSPLRVLDMRWNEMGKEARLCRAVSHLYDHDSQHYYRC